MKNLELALVIAFKFYIYVGKGLKLKGRTFLGLNLMFVEVTGENLVGQGESPFHRLPVSILYLGLTQIQDGEGEAVKRTLSPPYSF